MPKTVFILGAGASAPYKFPSGVTLVDLIIDELEKIFTRTQRQKSLLGRLLEKEGQLDLNLISSFKSCLFESQAYSIDAFLSRRREFREIGKQLIASILLEYEKHCLDNRYLFRPEKPEEHWYRYFFNEIKDQLDYDFRIYTFNYERSLEYFLVQTFRNYLNLTDEQIWERLKRMNITHLHGSLKGIETLNDLKNFDFGNTSKITEYSHLEILSDRIEVIYEVAESKFDELREDMKKAKNIVFIGFGFDRTNMQNMRLSEMNFEEGTTNIYATTYRMSHNEVQHRFFKYINMYSKQTGYSIPNQKEDIIKASNETAAEFLKNTLPHDAYSK
ncbi:SIR2 family protein [Sunxiuqinia rutila]|uniref:SIR2 family protein n=1 Tax=Sunxiuqinia rutila TaxID=1397841 RepID=UPI003D368A3B